MSEIARLKSRVYTEQVNVSVDMETKRRLLRLKNEKRINTAEEIRKVIADLVERLEYATLT